MGDALPTNEPNFEQKQVIAPLDRLSYGISVSNTRRLHARIS